LRRAEHTFFHGGLCADLFYGEADRRSGSWGGGSLALGGLSHGDDAAIRVDLGYVAFGALVGVAFVGDFGVGGVGEMGGLGRLRGVVGFGFDDESGAGPVAAVLAGVGGVSGAWGD